MRPTNYVNFHSNNEQIVGHIEQAEENRNNIINNNNNGICPHDTSNREVLELMTLPLNNSDPKLNDTYVNELTPYTQRYQHLSKSLMKSLANKHKAQ